MTTRCVHLPYWLCRPVLFLHDVWRNIWRNAGWLARRPDEHR